MPHAWHVDPLAANRASRLACQRLSESLLVYVFAEFFLDDEHARQPRRFDGRLCFRLQAILCSQCHLVASFPKLAKGQRGSCETIRRHRARTVGFRDASQRMKPIECMAFEAFRTVP